MLDFDLAELYGVPTKALNQAVTRNSESSQKISCSAERGGNGDSEPVTNCDRFPKTSRSALPTQSFHPRRCCYAFRRPAQQTGG